jgi:hypothetical protein
MILVQKDFFVERNFPSQKRCGGGMSKEWSGICKKIKISLPKICLNSTFNGMAVAQLMSLSIHDILPS